MKKTFSMLFLILAVLSTSAETKGTEKVRLALSEFAWEKRQLIVFSPTNEHLQYQQFKKALSEFGEEFDERNLQTWHVIANDKVRLNTRKLSGIENKQFREKYAVEKEEFRLLLIGYDQGEKLRQKEVNVDYIFSEIDQMPIRIQEMQKTKVN